MKKYFILIATIISVATIGQATAQTIITQDQGIRVSGYAEREIVPNQIFINITIDENDQRTAKSKLSLDQWQEILVKTLKKQGIDPEKNLFINDMGSNFRDFVLKKSQARTSISYQLELNSATQLSNVVTALANEGISNIDIDRVSHTDLQSFRDQLRVEAIKNAKANADALATAVGEKIDSVISIQDTGIYMNDMMPRPLMFASRASDSSAKESATPLDFQKIKLTHNLTAVFATNRMNFFVK